MIYTCTTNPSLDYYLSVSNLDDEELRSNKEYYDAGGKGVNVSIVLNNLKIPSSCLGFLGGFTKEYFLSFLKDYSYIQPLFTSIEDNTRINIKLNSNNDEKNINAKGPKITKNEFSRFTNRLDSIYEGDIFILSGNVQDEIFDDVVSEIHKLAENNVKVILNTDLNLVNQCLDIKPFMVKLSSNVTNFEEYANKLIESGVSNVLFSAINSKCHLITPEEHLVCNSFENITNFTTGTSDSMVAGYLYGYIKGGNCLESFKYAVASSLATMYTNDLANKEKIEEVYNSVEVIKI